MTQRAQRKLYMKNLEEINALTQKIIGCAIEVHRRLGPGLLESIYEKALCIELEHNGLKFERQKNINIDYRNKSLGNYKIDVLVENEVVLELKSVERNDPVFEAQLLSYMKLGNYKIGLLINFNKELVKQGISRKIL